MRILKDLQKEFNASDNNTSEKFSNNQLGTENFTLPKFKLSSKKGKLLLLDYILLVLGGPFSQIYYRIFKFNGSLDKPWLFFPLFWIFPFSAVPTYYISKKKLKMGNGSVNFLEFLGLLPMTGAIISHLMKNMYPSFKFASTLPLFIISMLAFFIKDGKKCSNNSMMRKLSRSSYSALIMLSLSIILHFLVMGFFQVLPFVGETFKLIYSSPHTTIIIYSIVTYVSYLLTNMINSTPSILKYCKKRSKKQFLIVSVSALVLSIIKIIIPGLLSGGQEEEEE